MRSIRRRRASLVALLVPATQQLVLVDEGIDRQANDRGGHVVPPSWRSRCRAGNRLSVILSGQSGMTRWTDTVTGADASAAVQQAGGQGWADRQRHRVRGADRRLARAPAHVGAALRLPAARRASRAARAAMRSSDAPRVVAVRRAAEQGVPLPRAIADAATRLPSTGVSDADAGGDRGRRADPGRAGVRPRAAARSPTSTRRCRRPTRRSRRARGSTRCRGSWAATSNARCARCSPATPPRLECAHPAWSGSGDARALDRLPRAGRAGRAADASRSSGSTATRNAARGASSASCSRS